MGKKKVNKRENEERKEKENLEQRYVDGRKERH